MKYYLIIFSTLLLSNCYMKEQITTLGSNPKLKPLLSYQKPQEVRIPIEPKTPDLTTHHNNSLWASGCKSFFKDQRAHKVGDSLLVIVNINGENAKIINETQLSPPDQQLNLNPIGVFGLETLAKKILPSTADMTKLIDVKSQNKFTAKAKLDRKETVDLKVAATITQVLPNGNFVIYAHHETRVGKDIRDVYIKGMVRPEDISSDNSIPFEDIAEGRISYGSRGQMTAMTRPGYGYKILQAIRPF